MKIQKGDAGYLRRRKRLLILEAVVSFGLVAALVIAGYVTTKTKLNLLTVVAVLGCLPASRILVNLIMVMPHDSIDEATELEISAVTEELTVAYDLVITSEKKAMPVAAVAIYDLWLCAGEKSGCGLCRKAYQIHYEAEPVRQGGGQAFP